MRQKVLIVQTDPKSAQPLVRYFKERGDEVWGAWDLNQAEALFEQVKPDLVYLDLHFPGEDWQDLVRLILERPTIRLVVTNKHPDLQREMQAQSLGVRVFLRQPFRPEWIERSLEKLGESTKTRRRTGAKKPVIRIPVRIKIILPYLVLSILFTLAVIYLISRVVIDSAQERYLNQLVATGKQATDWMVNEEDRLLVTLRLVANSQGVAEAIQSGDSEQLRSITLPLALNAEEEALEILDLGGISLLSIRQQPGSPVGNYIFTRGDPFFQSMDYIQAVLTGTVDERGDKFAGLAVAPWGNYFYISGPIYAPSGEKVGVVLVGRSLPTLVREMKAATLADITIYTLEGQPLATTFGTGADSLMLSPSRSAQVLLAQDLASQTRDLTVSSVSYTELLGAWEVRDQRDLGILGVTLPQAFLIQTSQLTRVQMIIIFLAAILLVVIVGLYLSSLITKPLTRLVQASSEVERGNLQVKVDSRGDDEVAVLAHAFNSMVAGLQEGFIYRDLLGRTVSPEVREQLRQTFTSGNLRLEGQEAIATVIMTDIRGFTTLSETAEPAKVFLWLNEYFGKLVPIVVAHGGVVNKFDGDAMLSFYGILPRMISPRRSATAACQTALEMLQAINELNELREARGEPPLITGIGVHTGIVTAGGLGSSDRMHYTIIGDTVNTTQRLESLTRQLFNESAILVSQATLDALGDAKDSFQFQELGSFTVRGKSERVTVFHLPTQIPPDEIDK